MFNNKPSLSQYTMQNANLQFGSGQKPNFQQSTLPQNQFQSQFMQSNAQNLTNAYKQSLNLQSQQQGQNVFIPQQNFTPVNFQSAGFNMIGAPRTKELDDAYLTMTNKMENQVNQNLMTSAAVSELEMILEGERRKAKEIRERIEADLENERRTRAEVEHRFIKLKDETLKREMLLSELDFKVCNLAQENNALNAENFSLKEELQKMSSQYETRLRDYEDKLQQSIKQGDLVEAHYQQEAQKQAHLSRVQIEETVKEWEARCKQYEEQMQKLAQSKKQLEETQRRLQDSLLQLKVDAQEELREMQMRVQQEEQMKFQSNLKMVEGKLHAAEDARDNVARKNQELIKQLQDKDRRIHEDFFRFENECGSLKHELSDLRNQYTQTDILLQKVRQELSQKDSCIARNNADLAELSKQNLQFRDDARQDMDKQLQEHNSQIAHMNDVRNQLERQNVEQEARLSEQARDLVAIKNEYDRLCNMLKSNINQTIFQTINEIGESRQLQQLNQSQNINFLSQQNQNRQETVPKQQYQSSVLNKSNFASGLGGVLGGGATATATGYTSGGLPMHQSSYINKY